MKSARVVAQAKLNLGLRILAREASGYHSIETLFARITLGDRITVRAGGTARSVDCHGADVGAPEENLGFRAARAFADAAGWPDGFEIEIEKVIPVGGGLGGGSADAGAVLRALNALAPRPLPEGELLRLAATLGSDVPFLTTSASLALAWGRGERMLRLPPLPDRDVVLIAPDFAIATRDAYAWLAAAEHERAAVAPRLLTADQLGGWESLAPLLANDFEPVVASRHPELRAMIEALREAGASIAHMSGSGSTVFGIFSRLPDLTHLSRSVTGRIITARTAGEVAAVEIEETPGRVTAAASGRGQRA